MEFERHIARILHEEHRATIAAMEQLDELVSGRRAANIPDMSDPGVAAKLKSVLAVLDTDIRGHFGFEENELFTRLADYGDEAIGAHLTEEHAVLLPASEQIAALANLALADGFTEDTWRQFRVVATDLVERMMTHIQKEEMGLLPLLEDVLDADTDFALTQIYSESL